MLYDNIKQVKLNYTQWNPLFLDFAGHYGFAPKTHRPYRPRTKGKVERAVHYLDGSFLRGRAFARICSERLTCRSKFQAIWPDAT